MPARNSGRALVSRCASRAGKGWAADASTAVGEQPVVVAGTNTAGTVQPQFTGVLRAEMGRGNLHSQALIARAQRRCDVLFGMHRDLAPCPQRTSALIPALHDH